MRYLKKIFTIFKRLHGLHNYQCIKVLSFFFFFSKFIYFWLHWVFVAARGLFSSGGEWGLLFVVVCRLLIAVASHCGARALGARA